MGCHLAGLCGLLIPSMIGGTLATMGIWLLKRGGSEFVDDQGREALNFQLSLLVYLFVSIALTFFVVGIFLLVPLAFFALICVVIASVKANGGTAFRYPLCIRFIK
jgi:uncharacterized Tic20 family protein